ncbi:tagatose-6-phosphate ketose/aldose isomerase [Spiroplasma litorale]|uniref:Tagatose-6-phosphate ketose/aldose isomerase n=1 Tax=Spiroplasma litorale TaxID=216942 RepID=A0A0K1W1Y3_9MOLU|nr:SIS domain-containing protein [Spiroplasma litorale]AKX34325.1 tagatose-6-phosphate ketose/aldose isomerase [Spiroplasma litorale]
MNSKCNTEVEIYQQPQVWKKVYDYFNKNKEELKKIAKKFKDYKIILTGAGTSQFVGDSIYNYFTEKGLEIYSIATTNLVVNPYKFIKKDEKVLLISFARSGNSPESVAAVDFLNKVTKNVHHLIITCNENGELYKLKQKLNNINTILLPEESNDKGFAMTSSFTSMLLACSLFLSIMINDDSFNKFDHFIKKVENSFEIIENSITNININNINRIVFLGDCEFYGLSKEARLKFLELTQGKIATFYDSFLGFRHGPKSILSENTLIFFLVSDNKNSKKFEFDLINEIINENKVKNLFIVSDLKNKEEINNISFDLKGYNTILTILQYIIFFQIFALRNSKSMGFNPDNPCPSGEVNRVVKKFKIHEGIFDNE